MKRFKNMLDKEYAKRVANAMKVICYFLVLFFVFGIIMSLIGRQTFILHTATDTYNNAIYAEKSHEWTSRGLTVSLNDEIRVITAEKIDFITHIGIFAIYLVTVLPLIISFLLLAMVFRNISKGLIFTEQNADYLLFYGLIRAASALCVPFIKLFISYITNLFTNSEISISTGQNMFNDFIPSIAFLVAAYVIHHGIHLQDEADHTI